MHAHFLSKSVRLRRLHLLLFQTLDNLSVARHDPPSLLLLIELTMDHLLLGKCVLRYMRLQLASRWLHLGSRSAWGRWIRRRHNDRHWQIHRWARHR